MSQQTGPTHAAATYVQNLMAGLDLAAPMTLGNAETGKAYPLPPELADIIREILLRYASGRQVTIADKQTELTPNQAAGVLNVSRTYVMKLIEDGTLPSRMVGSHHRIPEADVAAYKREQDARSRVAMDELVRLSQEMGLYDIDQIPDKSTFRGGNDR